MTPPYICSSCRWSLAQVRPQKVIQWHSRATFISLAGARPQTSVSSGSKDELLKLGDNAPERRGRYAAILPERKRRVPFPKHPNQEDALEALFADVVNTPKTASGVNILEPNRNPKERSQQGADLPSQAVPSYPMAQHNPPQQSSSSLQPFQQIEAIKGILEDPGRMGEAWTLFVKHFGQENLGLQAPLYVVPLATSMRNGLVLAKVNDPLSKDVPSASEICQVYLRIGQLQGSWWCDMVLVLVENILRVKKHWPRDHSQEQMLLEELLGAWNVVCRPTFKTRYQLPPGSSLDWSNLPSISTREIENYTHKRGTVASFELLVPPLRSRDMGKLPLATFATFDLLTDDTCKALKAMPSHLTRFKILLGQFVALPTIAATTSFQSYVDDKFAKEVESYVKENLITIRQKALSMTTRQTELMPKREHQPYLAHEEINTRSSTISKRIRDAVSRHNLATLDGLWEDALRWPVREEASPDGNQVGRSTGTMTLELCNLFMLSFMSLRQPAKSISVWNHLVGCGFVPTLKTWESMLSGCRAARHWMGMEEVWRRMQILDVIPDVALWTTRISGLIDCRQYDLGIRALDEMGRIWLAAARLKHPRKTIAEVLLVDDVNTAAKPSIDTVNAAINGLLLGDKIQSAKQILAWASKFGIPPNIITYNTLLKCFVKTDRSIEAVALLQQMSRSGIQADVVTFTTILDFTLSNAKDMTPAQQGELVKYTFDSMAHAGIQPNAHTYSKIIFELLQTSNGDLTVVNTVLERMGKQGLEPSPHIFTALIEHYFQQEVPDLDLIRALISRASSVVGSVDHIFWDRVTEGYARIGETEAALKVVAKSHASKSSYSWRTMSTLMIALVQKEEWETARLLVRNAARDTGGPIREDTRGREGQHIFWKNAYDLELVDSDIGMFEDPNPPV